MTTGITVSVCIANYNGIEVLDDCIQSVQNQIGEINIEILIHDDASTDDSVSHIQKLYPQINLIKSKKNVGFCVANNRMAAQAKGQYLLLLNNDAALYSDGISSLLKEANALPKPAILTLPQYDATTGDLVDRGCLLDPFYNPVPNLDSTRSDVAMVIGACLWVPKEIWDEIEGFPEWFGSIAEDMYLCCRARLAGYFVRVLATSGYRHWQGKSFGGGGIKKQTMSTTFRRRSLSECNKTYVMIIVCSNWALGILLPLHLMLLMLEGALLTVARGDLAYLRKIYLPVLEGLIKEQKKLRSIRSEVQRKKQDSNNTPPNVTVWLPYKVKMFCKYGLPNVR